MTTTRIYQRIVFVLVILLANACDDKDTSNSQGLSSSVLLDFSSIKNKFMYKDLSEFSIDTIPWDRRPSFYHTLDTIEYYKIYQDTSKQYLGLGGGNLDIEYFYSIQKSPRGFIELTILSQMEGEYCDILWYKIYDRTGKLMSSFPVARGCGDGGYFENASGKFLNDSTYDLISVDNYQTVDIEQPNIITHSRTRTIIRFDGSISSKDTTLMTEVEGTGANSALPASPRGSSI